jgi:hypothetical protein
MNVNKMITCLVNLFHLILSFFISLTITKRVLFAKRLSNQDLKIK